MKTLDNKKGLQKGSSIIIALVVVVLVIVALNYFGFTFSSVWASIKGFFGI
ncbi:MAG: hypothetical protein WC264_01720 [Candidatus Paceibacterota bacterium]|jgi:hypothetical protein